MHVMNLRLFLRLSLDVGLQKKRSPSLAEKMESPLKMFDYWYRQLVKKVSPGAFSITLQFI